jgi:hypothetical protein
MAYQSVGGYNWPPGYWLAIGLRIYDKMGFVAKPIFWGDCFLLIA